MTLRPTRRSRQSVSSCPGTTHCTSSRLEHHGNGSRLDSVEAVERFAASMTCKGVHRVVQRVTIVHETGVKLTKEAMLALETRLRRLPALGKWFVDILSWAMSA